MKYKYLFVTIFLIVVGGVYAYTQLSAVQDSESDVLELQENITRLEQQYELLQNELVQKESQLDSIKEQAENKTTSIRVANNKLLRNALLPPYSTIAPNYLVTGFAMTDGTLYKLQTPLQYLTQEIVEGERRRSNPKPNEYEFLNVNLNGKDYRVMDMRPFVDSEPFLASMPSIYEIVGDDEQFIKEVWYMVTQFNQYIPEMGENPQTPVETLFLGTGDCEDSSILIASMLKAARPDWEINFVYTDYFNPADPQVINHILLSVTIDDKTIFIEATNSEEINPHGKVVGTSFAI